MLKQWTFATLMTLNLSYAPVEGLQHHANASNNDRVPNNNPFSGAREFSISLEREGFTTPKPPVPYWEFWANELNQTAQQYVAILSLIQSEYPDNYNAILRLHRDWLRLRDRQIIEEMFKQWK